MPSLRDGDPRKIWEAATVTDFSSAFIFFLRPLQYQPGEAKRVTRNTLFGSCMFCKDLFKTHEPAELLFYLACQIGRR